jgi:hypothetical protein
LIKRCRVHGFRFETRCTDFGAALVAIVGETVRLGR